MSENNQIQDEENVELNLIKFGLITQKTPILDALSIFREYFDYLKPTNYAIKSEISFVFTPEDLFGVSLSFHIIREIKKIKEY